MSISENLSHIHREIGPAVSLVAVSKTKPVEAILEAYHAGQRVFGENKVQEMTDKWNLLPKDISWHLIGHLQTNKVKYIAPYVSLIHSVDSIKLLSEINKQAAKHNRIIPCLLQFHIAQEETKFGFSKEEAEIIIQSEEYLSMQNISIVGVMGMASFVSDENQVRQEFKSLNSIFSYLKNSFFKSSSDFKIISMGMSGDYQVAIEEGSNMIRVGSSIFGTR
jgi:pyridoxal phosphate enzyme (YggS family)